MRSWLHGFAALAVLVLLGAWLRRGSIDPLHAVLIVGLGVACAFGGRTIAAILAVAVVGTDMALGFPPGAELWVRFARKGAWSLAAACALWWTVPPAWEAIRGRLAGLRVRLGAAPGIATAVALIAGFVVLRRLGADHPLGPDAGWFLMSATKVAEGQVPYVDFASFYHAGAFYVQAAAFRLLGSDGAAVRLQIVVQHVAVLASLCAVLAMRARVGAAGIAVLAAAYVAFVPLIEGLLYMLEPMSSAFGWAALAAATWKGRRPGGAFAAALLASAALWAKQPGGAFLVALAIPHLDSGRFERRLAVAQAFGFLLLPAIFFAAHPAAAGRYWDQNVVRLFSYASGEMVPLSSSREIVNALVQNALVPAVVMLSTGVAVAAVRRRIGGVTRGDVAVLAAGVLLLAPSLMRPYRHYYLYSLPFALFGAAVCVRAIGSMPRWVGATALVALLMGGSTYVRLAAITTGRDAGALSEAQISAFIASRLGGHDAALIVPKSPEYHFLSGARSVDGDYTFIYHPASFEAARPRFEIAARDRRPAFVVDTGEEWVEPCRERLRALGFRLRDSEGPVEYWTPP